MSREGGEAMAAPISREQLLEELRWDTDVAEAVAAIKQQQEQSGADAHGGAAKQRGESFFGGTARRLSRGTSGRSGRGGSGTDARSGVFDDLSRTAELTRPRRGLLHAASPGLRAWGGVVGLVDVYGLLVPCALAALLFPEGQLPASWLWLHALCDLLLLTNTLLPLRTAFHDPLLDVTITCPTLPLVVSIATVGIAIVSIAVRHDDHVPYAMTPALSQVPAPHRLPLRAPTRRLAAQLARAAAVRLGGATRRPACRTRRAAAALAQELIVAAAPVQHARRHQGARVAAAQARPVHASRLALDRLHVPLRLARSRPGVEPHGA